jgi:dynein heavy chain
MVTHCHFFTGFCDSFITSLKAWQQYYDCPDIEKAVLPHPWNKHLSTFQKLVVVRVFHPDKVSGMPIL